MTLGRNSRESLDAVENGKMVMSTKYKIAGLAALAIVHPEAARDCRHERAMFQCRRRLPTWLVVKR
jgi:hypothetical protein